MTSAFNVFSFLSISMLAGGGKRLSVSGKRNDSPDLSGGGWWLVPSVDVGAPWPSFGVSVLGIAVRVVASRVSVFVVVVVVVVLVRVVAPVFASRMVSVARVAEPTLVGPVEVAAVVWTSVSVVDRIGVVVSLRFGGIASHIDVAVVLSVVVGIVKLFAVNFAFRIVSCHRLA